MSFTVTQNVRRVSDHFEPDAALDPQEQKQMRAHLERIDFATFAANREVLGQTVQGASLESFQRLAVFTAQARGKWVAAALLMVEKGEAMNADDVAHLANLRRAFEELTDAYEALRRMVERGYLKAK